MNDEILNDLLKEAGLHDSRKIVSGEIVAAWKLWCKQGRPAKFRKEGKYITFLAEKIDEDRIKIVLFWKTKSGPWMVLQRIFKEGK